MAYHLIVVIPFADYQRGDVITDQALVASIHTEEVIQHCVRVTAPADQAGE